MNPPPAPRENPDTQVSDRRRHRRRASTATVRLFSEPCEIAGAVDNVSRSGLLFFSEGNLRVRVELLENGVVTKRTGRIVRAARMRGDSFGWAVEFDP
jgi:pectin methylesterase-like acyl-CoA thioesterase